MKTYIDSAYIQKTKHHRIITQAVKFFTDNRMKGRGRIIVSVTPFAKDKKFKNGIAGQADIIAKGLFLISLSNRTANEIMRLEPLALEILFHELEHCRQFHRGELTYSKNLQNLVWKGRSMKKVPYKKHPHEKQANKIGAEYAKDFLKVFPTKLKRGAK